MADNQLIASMPFMTLDSGCTITVEAIDPASGATVAGVTVSAVTIYGSNLVVTPAATVAVPNPILLSGSPKK